MCGFESCQNRRDDVGTLTAPCGQSQQRPLLCAKMTRPARAKKEAPPCRHADYCGASFAGGIRSVDSTPRRTWPDRLPFPLSYGRDSGTPARRVNQLWPATSQPSRPVPNDCRAAFGWRPTEDRHVRVLTDLPNAAPRCDRRRRASIRNVCRRRRAEVCVRERGVGGTGPAAFFLRSNDGMFTVERQAP